MILARGRAAASIDGERRGALAAAGIKLVVLTDAAAVPGGMKDMDGTYAAWFDAHCCDIAAIRPDFHIWGTAGGDAQRRTP